MKNTVYVIGTGPGGYEGMTVEAVNTLKACSLIVGYTAYTGLISKYFPDKEILSTGMRQEVERCRLAFENAREGRTVAMVCSGDAGVYGMAGLMLELLPEYPDCKVKVIAGVTSACSGAAVLGAPLMHDFAVISLSDLLTPWEIIDRRLRAAAEADFVICIYNPASRKRYDYLKRACETLMEYKPADTACGYVRNTGREDMSFGVMRLDELKDFEADMFTTVYIGNKSTGIRDMFMITKRGYRI